LHAAVALARENDADGLKVLLRDMDNLPQEQLPSLVRLLGRVTEPKARAQLAPELDRRAASTDVPLALAAAAVKLEWQPEPGIFRMLAALGAPTRTERDLAEKYLLRDERAIITELLRRALAREGRPLVRDQTRRILDVRADRAAAKPLAWPWQRRSARSRTIRLPKPPSPSGRLASPCAPAGSRCGSRGRRARQCPNGELGRPLVF